MFSQDIHSPKCPGGRERDIEKERKKEGTHVLTQTMSINTAEMCGAGCVWTY